MAIRVVHAVEMTERDWFEAESKGYLSHCFLCDSSCRFYPVMFFDPVRLAQDIEANHATTVVFAGMLIVVPKVTKFWIDAAANDPEVALQLAWMSPALPQEIGEQSVGYWPPRREPVR